MTEYLILKKEGIHWAVIASKVKASSGRRAIAIGPLDGEGEYVAVPERSFRPLPVKTEQTTKVTIG